MSTPFLESPRFPECLSYTSSGGPKYSTTVVTVFSGQETRNKNWLYPLHTYDAANENRNIEETEMLLEHFHACAGMYYGFRFKDWLDYKSCSVESNPSFADQIIGVGDGEQKEFQLIKKYTKGVNTQIRIINKPVNESVLIGIDNVLSSTGWSVDITTGIVTFVTAPANGEIISAGYEFDVPVRFSSDEFAAVWSNYKHLSINIPLQEIRL